MLNPKSRVISKVKLINYHSRLKPTFGSAFGAGSSTTSFSSPKSNPFGSATSSSSSTFGGGAFGSSTSAFGQKSTGGGFGSNPFGSSTRNVNGEFSKEPEWPFRQLNAAL